MAQERAPDRTNQQFESVKHDEPHFHPEPVPHLERRLDDHGPDVSHPHVHQQGGGRVYNHHGPDADDGSGHDPATDPHGPLKLDGDDDGAADNHDAAT